MGENSKIEWTDHTFNPWTGCAKVSEACRGCYAEAWAKRTGRPELWRGDRRRTSAANWRKPRKWNQDAERDGVRRRVFCASLADVFEEHSAAPLDKWRGELFELIRDTPALDWLLLTKRPENIARMLPGEWGDGYPNVWLGTTVENQARADERIPHLLRVPAAVHFLSAEPLLAPVVVADYLRSWCPECGRPLIGGTHFCGRACGTCHATTRRVGWVIAGGESGPGARIMRREWARSLRAQCVSAGVPFFFKQWGEFVPADHPNAPGDVRIGFARVGKKAAGRELDGRTWDEFPKVHR